MKVPLSKQIDAVEVASMSIEASRGVIVGLKAALSTLKWVERHQAELRVLGEFPGVEIRVLTPSDPGSSATSQEGSVEPTALSGELSACPFCGGDDLHTLFHHNGHTRLVCIGCHDCEAEGPATAIGGEGDASAARRARMAWNERNASATADRPKAVNTQSSEEFPGATVVVRDRE